MCIPVCVKVKGKDRRGGGWRRGKLTSTYFHWINRKVGERSSRGSEERLSNQTRVVGPRVEVILLELDVNLQLLAYKLIMPKKGALTKLHKHALVCPFVILPYSLPLSQHMHSFTPSPSPWMPLARCHLERERERDVIHYLTFQLSLDGPPLLRSAHGSVSQRIRPRVSPPPPRGASVSGNISVPQSAE